MQDSKFGEGRRGLVCRYPPQNKFESTEYRGTTVAAEIKRRRPLDPREPKVRRMAAILNCSSASGTS